MGLCRSKGCRAASHQSWRSEKNSAERPSAGEAGSLLTQALCKSLEALIMYFISIQSTLVSIGLISKGAVFVGPICTQLLRTDGGEMMNYLKCVFEALP